MFLLSRMYLHDCMIVAKMFISKCFATCLGLCPKKKKKTVLEAL